MMATLADMFSVPVELELDGKLYPLRQPNPLEQGKFQRWLEQRAYDAISRRTYSSPEEQDRDRERLTDKCAAGMYEWGGQLSAEAVLQPAGASKIVEMVCGVDAVTARRIIDKHQERIGHLFRAAASNDPKEVREALKALGLPATLLDDAKPSSSGSETRRSPSRKKKSRR